MKAFKVEVQGCNFYGTWRLVGENVLEVRSLYGTRFVHSADDPPREARDALQAMIPRLERRFS